MDLVVYAVPLFIAAMLVDGPLEPDTSPRTLFEYWR